jgi:acyl dehydratase
VPGPLYLEDFFVGQRFTSGSCTVSRDDIVSFARAFDPQPFHLDEEAALGGPFGGLAASGWHTAGITMRLLVEGGAPIAGGIVGAGAELTWLKPVRPGDTLTVKSDVISTRPSRSRPDRGVVVLTSETLNQLDEVVQRLTSTMMVPRRPAESGPR